MKHFYNIFQFIILLLLILSTVIVYTFWQNYYLNTSLIETIFLLWILVLINFMIITMMVNNFFHKPIKYLEFIIKSFYIWNLKWTNIKFKKTVNPHLNSSLKFFEQTLNTLKNIKTEFLHWKTIKWEVEIAKEIQSKMLNLKREEIEDFDIIVKSKPAWEIGWDSYDMIKTKDNFYIYVWDATGHWVWAWFIMTMVNALISGFSNIYHDWAKILSETNRILKPRIRSHLLMSLLLLRWDIKNKKLYMTWAWHEYLIVYKQKTDEIIKIKSGWIALWMARDIRKILKEKQIEIEVNDIIVIYSDWITEAYNSINKENIKLMYGIDKLIKSIRKTNNIKWEDFKSARWVFNNITIELSKFMWYRYTQHDDITLAVIHYKPKNFNKNNDKNEEINPKFITKWNWN
jgi:serine phosphatase RsbU (regulator of sigma subunit)